MTRSSQSRVAPLSHQACSTRSLSLPLAVVRQTACDLSTHVSELQANCALQSHHVVSCRASRAKEQTATRNSCHIPSRGPIYRWERLLDERNTHAAPCIILLSLSLSLPVCASACDTRRHTLAGEEKAAWEAVRLQREGEREANQPSAAISKKPRKQRRMMIKDRCA